MLKEKAQAKYAQRTITSIDRRENLSHKELVEKYVEPGIPVVITDATKNWPGKNKFTPDFFRKNYGHVSKEVNGVNYTLAEVLDLILKPSPEKPAPYPFNLNIEEHFPELLKDLKPELICGRIDRVNHPLLPRFMMHGTIVYEFFSGGKGAAFPYLHIDALCLHTQLTQLWGSKDVLLFPPEQDPLMYPGIESPKYSQVNLRNPDYDKFPLFRQAKPFRVTVKEGETIFFPTGWWHSTEIHEPNITFTRIQLNRQNWKKYIHDEYTVWKNKSTFMGPAVMAYGTVLGQLMNLQEKFTRQ